MSEEGEPGLIGPPAGPSLSAGLVAIGGATLAWVLAFELNALAFGWTAWATGIGWVFLPAAVRLGAVLLFGWRGALGIGLGSLVTSIAVFPGPPVLLASIALASALSPVAAVWLTLGHFRVSATLAGLTARHLIVCTVLYAAINALSHNLIFWQAGALASPLEGLLPMFIGDLLGAFLVLYLVRILIAAHAKRVAV